MQPLPPAVPPQLSVLERLVQDAPVAFCLLDTPSFCVRLANRRQLWLWETKASVEGRPLSAIAPAFWAVLHAPLLQVLERGRSYEAAALPVPHRNGADKRWLNVTATPLPDATGGIGSVLLTTVDVTEAVGGIQAATNLAAAPGSPDSGDLGRTVLEATPDAIKVLDTQGRILFMNRSSLLLKGIADFDAVHGRHWRELWPTDCHPQVDAAIRQALAGERAHFQAYFQVSEESRRWLDVWVSPVVEAGRVNRLVAVSRDITADKEAIERQEKTAAQLALATASAGAGTWVYHLVSGHLEWDSLHKSLWGYAENRNDLGYADWHAVIHPDDKPRCFAEVEAALRERRLYEADYRIHRASDGAERWIKSVGQYQFNNQGEATTLTGISLDVTTHKQAEAALLASEDRFRSTFDNAAVGLAHVGLDGTWQYINQRLADFLGYAKTELEQCTFQEVTHPDDLLADLAYVNELLAGHILSYAMEKRYIRKSGEVVWANLTVSLRRNEDGKPQHFISVVEDINTRKQTEAALQEQQTLTQSIIEAAPSLTYIFDISTGRNVFISSQIKDMLGYSPADVAAMGADLLPSLLHPDDVPATTRRFEKIMTEPANAIFETEYRMRHRNGSYVWFFDRARVFRRDAGGGAQEILGVATDISRRKRAEEAIRESEHRFRTLAEALPQMVWMGDAMGRTEYISNEWFDYTGTTAIAEAWQTVVHPDDQASLRDAWQTRFAAGLPLRLDLRLRHHSGNYRWHHAAAEPVHDATGAPAKWIVTLNDIHEQKTFSENLEALVAERTRELQRSNEDLQQFAHVASHDLKEPVRKVLTFGSRLREEFGPQLSDTAAAYLSKIEKSAARMYAMIEGVLAYSLLNAPEQETEAVDLNQVMTNIRADLELPIAQKETTLRLQPLPVVQGHPTLLYQLLYNLVANALKFSHGARNPVITVGTCTEEAMAEGSGTPPRPGFVRLFVRDNGIGFPPEAAEKIFQTFTRLNTRDTYEGTGLGLALCRKIAERHGGTVRAEGRPGEGAVFYLDLPTARC